MLLILKMNLKAANINIMILLQTLCAYQFDKTGLIGD
jgi:hypothetical protein